MPGNNAVSYAVLYHDLKYQLPWWQAQPGTDVLVEWLFEGSPFQEGDKKSPSDLPVMWSTSA